MKNRILQRMYKTANFYFDIEPEDLYYEHRLNENKDRFLNLDKEKINNKYKPAISSLMDDLNEIESIISEYKSELKNLDIELFNDEDSSLAKIEKKFREIFSDHIYKFSEFANAAKKDGYCLRTKRDFLKEENKD